MSKLNNVAIKLDKHINVILKVIIEKCDKLESENRIYREEILRLEKIQKDLINFISKYELKVKSKEK